MKLHIFAAVFILSSITNIQIGAMAASIATKTTNLTLGSVDNQSNIDFIIEAPADPEGHTFEAITKNPITPRTEFGLPFPLDYKVIIFKRGGISNDRTFFFANPTSTKNYGFLRVSEFDNLEKILIDFVMGEKLIRHLKLEKNKKFLFTVIAKGPDLTRSELIVEETK